MARSTKYVVEVYGSPKPSYASTMASAHKKGVALAKKYGKNLYYVTDAISARTETFQATRKNPFGLFKSYYVICDGKKFGPFKTTAKAKKLAVSMARVLDKPAKIMGAAKSASNPKKRKPSPRSAARKTVQYRRTKTGKRKRVTRRRSKNPAKSQFVVEWGTNTNFFDTLKQAKKYKSGLYSRGLLFGRRVKIVRVDPGEKSKIIFDKTY